MSEYYNEGYCENCNQDLDTDPGGGHDEHHWLCWECWRAENEPEPKASPDAVAGERFTISDRRVERLLERLHDLELRVAELEWERRSAR
jgi:hypothetical protein